MAAGDSAHPGEAAPCTYTTTRALGGSGGRHGVCASAPAPALPAGVRFLAGATSAAAAAPAAAPLRAPLLGDLFADVVVDTSDADPPPAGAEEEGREGKGEGAGGGPHAAASPPPPPPPPGDDDDGIGPAPPGLPWALPTSHIRSRCVRLHNEIVAFAAAMAPTPAEAASRAAAVDRLRSVVVTIWPAASVVVFGSTAAGLALPTSDVDVAVLGAASPDPPSSLRALAAGLLRAGVAADVQVIARARVPIAKYTDVASGLAVDASLDGGSGGPPAAAAAGRWLGALPALRPLLTVLKTVLHQRDLAEVYTGGLGSYALLVMVAAFLVDKQHSGGRGGGRGRGGGGRGGAPPEACLGTLLLDCVDLYGRRLNAASVGVTLHPGSPIFFPKHRVPWTQPGRPGGLAVGDPGDPRNDLAGGSWAVRRVRDAFAHIGTALAAPPGPGEGPGASLLARIIRLDAVVAGRAGSAALVAAACAGAAAAAAVGGGGGDDGRWRGRGGDDDDCRRRSYTPQPRPPPPKRRRTEWEEEGEEGERRGRDGGGHGGGHGRAQHWGAGGERDRGRPAVPSPAPAPTRRRSSPPRSAKRAKAPSHKRFE